MTAVVVTYILGEPKIALGRFIPVWGAFTLGGCIAGALFLFYLYLVIFKFKKVEEDNLVAQE